MYIHYTEIKINNSAFCQVIFGSEKYWNWSPILDRYNFFLGKSDFANAATPLIALYKQIPSNQRAYDKDLKIWTIPAATFFSFETLYKALHVTLIKHNRNFYDLLFENPNKQKNIYPDEFFYQQPEQQGTVLTSEISKEDIENNLRVLLEINPNITFSIISKDDLKKLYRKAALKLHPDRNNGDGSRMTELNFWWQELQKL